MNRPAWALRSFCMEIAGGDYNEQSRDAGF